MFVYLKQYHFNLPEYKHALKLQAFPSPVPHQPYVRFGN